MKKILIIGWYGTETIGDRAILAGIISFINKAFDDYHITLGSLYPFFSKRTLSEDQSFINEIINKKINISIIDTRDSKVLRNNILASDLLIMGGGPLMDIEELAMVEYAFKIAKKANIKTAIIGCGVGPLYEKKNRKTVNNIIGNSDLTIFRDNKSNEFYNEIKSEFNHDPVNTKSCFVSFDPAVECALKFNEITKNNIGFNINEEYISINLREFPLEYSNQSKNDVNDRLIRMMRNIDNDSEMQIKLIPMHYFHIGTDDRVFFEEVKEQIKSENITIQNENLSLKQTLNSFKYATTNVGMRFHAVVLQTIVSGRNYILDYTEPNKGKISGFIEDIDNYKFYENRFYTLQDSNSKFEDISINHGNEKFIFDESKLFHRLSIYSDELRKLII